MIVISVIVVVVALISLYDYFSSKNWQQITSDKRNDTVFHTRNRQYGAYVIRRDYNKQLAFIIGGVVLGTGVLYAATRKNSIQAADIKKKDYEVVYVLPPKNDEKPEVPTKQTDPVQNTQPSARMDLFAEPTPTDDDVAPIDIPDGTTDVGNEHRDDGSEFGGTLPENPNPGGGGNIVEKPEPPGPVEIPDEFAEFPGGRPAMVDYLQKNLNYPPIAYQLGISGKCHLRFVVDKKGEISEVKVERGVQDCAECDKEAVKAVKKMPLWRPGRVKGKPVDSYFRLPIKFEVK